MAGIEPFVLGHIDISPLDTKTTLIRVTISTRASSYRQVAAVCAYITVELDGIAFNFYVAVGGQFATGNQIAASIMIWIIIVAFWISVSIFIGVQEYISGCLYNDVINQVARTKNNVMNRLNNDITRGAIQRHAISDVYAGLTLLSGGVIAVLDPHAARCDIVVDINICILIDDSVLAAQYFHMTACAYGALQRDISSCFSP